MAKSLGQYDYEVENFIRAFEPSSENEVKTLHKHMQDCFKLVENYCESVISREDVFRMLDKVEQSIPQNKVHEILETIRSQLLLKGYLSKEDVLKAVTKLGNCALKMLIILSNKSEGELKKLAYSIYLKKNEAYNDGWHKLGVYRIFLDLYRKMYRLSNLILEDKESPVADETLFDNVLDTFNYCSFMLVGLTIIESR